MSIWIEQMSFLLARKDNIFCKDILKNRYLLYVSIFKLS